MQELDDKFVESEQNLGAARLRIKQLDTSLQVGGEGRGDLFRIKCCSGKINSPTN